MVEEQDGSVTFDSKKLYEGTLTEIVEIGQTGLGSGETDLERVVGGYGTSLCTVFKIARREQVVVYDKETIAYDPNTEEKVVRSRIEVHDTELNRWYR